jgi:hypothetical protein
VKSNITIHAAPDQRAPWIASASGKRRRQASRWMNPCKVRIPGTNADRPRPQLASEGSHTVWQGRLTWARFEMFNGATAEDQAYFVGCGSLLFDYAISAILVRLETANGCNPQRLQFLELFGNTDPKRRLDWARPTYVSCRGIITPRVNKSDPVTSP